MIKFMINLEYIFFDKLNVKKKIHQFMFKSR